MTNDEVIQRLYNEFVGRRKRFFSSSWGNFKSFVHRILGRKEEFSLLIAHELEFTQDRMKWLDGLQEESIVTPEIVPDLRLALKLFLKLFKEESNGRNGFLIIAISILAIGILVLAFNETDSNALRVMWQTFIVISGLSIALERGAVVASAGYCAQLDVILERWAELKKADEDTQLKLTTSFQDNAASPHKKV